MTSSVREKALVNQATLESINYALVRANKMSSRAGIAWVLLDENKKVIHSDATIAGINVESLSASIKYFGKKLEQLIITAEPVPYLFNIENLIEQISASSCKSLIVCYNMSNEIANPLWNDWLDNWDGEIIRLPFSLMSANLFSGPRKILTNARPWVTAISGADMFNNNKNINDFSEEFGVTAYITELVNQSRAILYSADQKAILDKMDEGNFVDEAHEYFEVNSAESCEAIFRHCIIEKRCSVLVLANLELLAKLMHSNFADEIVYHLAVTFEDVSNKTVIEENNTGDNLIKQEGEFAIFQSTQNTQLPPLQLPLSRWTLQSSTAVGKCSRLLLKSNTEIDVENQLRLGLN